MRQVWIAAVALAMTGCGSGAPTAPANGETASAATPTDSSEPGPIDESLPTTPASADVRTRCDGIVGFLTDPDPVGRIVRAGPSRSEPELGRIPPPVVSEEWGGAWPYEFDVIGSEDGWLLIENARLDDSAGVATAKPAFAGQGWIAGGGVRIGIQARVGFAKPSHAAPVLIDARPAGTVLDAFGPRRIVGCDGRWVLADFDAQSPDGAALSHRAEAVAQAQPKRLRAWVTGVCNLLETTCDGIDGTRAETSGLGDGG